MTDPKTDADADIPDALARQRAGDAAAAETVYRRVLETQPGHAEAQYLLGLARHQQGAHAEALGWLRKARRRLGGRPEVETNIGLVELAAGDARAAAATLGAVVDGGGAGPDARAALAVAHRRSGAADAAERALRALTDDHPAYAPGWFNLGNLLLDTGRPGAAGAALERAHALAPEDAGIARNLAVARQTLGDLGGARRLLERVLARHPNDAAALNNLGMILRQRGDLAGARTTLRRARNADPGSADAAYNLGATLADLNDTRRARAAFRDAARLRPGFSKAAWAGALTLPQIYAAEAEIEAARALWLDGLDRLAETPAPNSADEIREALAAAAEITPFALAYQGRDDTAAMHRFGDMVHAIATRAFPGLAASPSPPARARRRIGFVSAHFRDHTVTRLFGAWLAELDRDRFEVHMISTSGPGDDTTQGLAAAVDAAHLAPGGIAELAARIHGLAADVLVYPDIGMDPRTQVLAALPLAPRQAMGWGHPVTSGLPTVDAFLSAETMEPADGDAHYRETLVRLPNLSVSFERPPVPDGDAPAHAFLCAQSLFKVPPGQDAVFADIARACPGSRIAFIAHPIDAVTKAFYTRISAAFRARGVDPEARLAILPPAPRVGFLGYLKGARVVLDTFDWSGGNTSLEAFAMGTPVLTLPGPFMRGRHTAAMLTRMALPELIAADAADYAARAVRLFEDDAAHADIRDAVRARSGRLFDDPAPVRALNRFLADF